MFRLVSIVLMVSGLLSAGQEKKGLQEKSGTEQTGKAGQAVESETIERQVSCQQILEVRSLINDRVSDVLVKKGERVHIGQLLLKLGAGSIEAEISEIENSLKEWKEILFKREHWKVRSERAEQQAREKLETFQKQLQEKKAERQGRQIHALITGRVIDIVSVGTEVSDETVVANIGDDSVLKIDLSPEDIPPAGQDFLRTGERISLTFAEINLACSGEIRRKADSISIMIPNEKFLIAPGMTARFQIEIPPMVKPPVFAREKKTAKKRKTDARKKKMEWELSAGLSYADQGQYGYRADGIDVLIEQFAGNYGIDYAVSGGLGKNIITVPLQALVNYTLSDKWYVKAGLEFGTGSDSPSRTYDLDWGTSTETVRYDLSTKLTYWMPFVGAETRFGTFGIYAHLGFNWLSFSHQKDHESSTGSFWFRQSDSISANGSGFGLQLGGKSFLDIGEKIKLVIKLEFCYLRIGNVKGSRNTVQSSSSGDTFSESVDGFVYSFETNPYDLGWFHYWELYEVEPAGSDFRNVGKFLLNLSGIRLMIGIAF